MNDVSIELEEGRGRFRPGEKLSGSVTWSTDAAPAMVEVRLFWFTLGVSLRQVGMVKKTVFTRPSARDTRRFEFLLPAGPSSFRGRLAGLSWAVEAVLLPSQASASAHFEISADGQTRVLHRQRWVEDEADS